MNAYELADIVDKWAHSESAEYLTDAATMLRQQADRIAELEKALMLAGETKWDIVKDGKIIERNYEVSNKPVAYRHWMVDDEFPEDSCWEYFDSPTGEDCKECHPLYTHPVKQLTLERLEELYQHSHGNTEYMRTKSFMRAIIKEITE